MRKLDASKAQYVDLSYGWQGRGDALRLRRRRHHRWTFLLAGFAALAGLCWWLI